jgi:hypothetical protein
MSLQQIFISWFDKINYDNIYEFDNFIPCLEKLQQYIDNIEDFNSSENINIYTDKVQEEILDIIRNELILFCIDDIYHIILEHIIVKNILILKPSPYYFKDILEERLEIINEMYSNLPLTWLSNNYPVLLKFRNYFD